VTRGGGRSGAVGIALISILAACGGKEALSPVGLDSNTSPQTPTKATENPVAGHLVASVGERTLGPFFARRGNGIGAAGLVAWVTVAEGPNRRVLVVPVNAKGVPRGAETPVALVSVDTTMLVVRPTGGETPGFLVAWTSLTDRGKSIWSVTVGDDGTPRGKPIELSRTNDDIVWLDIVPTDHGALCLWAEETRGNDANLVAAAIDNAGKIHGVPTRVARGVVGWHALDLPGGVGVSVVEAPPSDPKAKPPDNRLIRETRPGGALSFLRLDAEGQRLAPPIVVTNKPIVSGDVEVAREGSRLVFAWTDRTTADPAVAMAAIDGLTGRPDDKPVVTPPRKIAEARGGASLLALAGGPAGAALMFEAPVRRKGESRRVHTAHVAPGLTLGKPLSLQVVGRGQPELAATSTGFAVLATIPDCEQDSPSCLNADAVATIFRTDEQGAVLQREPLTFITDPATLGWGMTCEGETCFTLAASPGAGGAPSRVRSVAIRPRTNAKAAPPKPTELANEPHVTDVTAVVSGESVVDIATARFGETNIVAMLSSKGTERRTSSEEARTVPMTLSTRIVDDNGAAQAPQIITTKALHVGGVAIAGGEKPEDGGAIAWVARENGDPEVHVTRLDRRGRKTGDVQLTTVKGDATDVTITWAGNGWIIAWVDGRDGNGEVYATKVSTDLSRSAREERITKAPGDASDLVAFPNGDTVWLAWADSRESPRDGLADIYVSAVKMQNAKRVFDDQRVFATAAHSRTPHFASGPKGMTVAWIEEAPMGSESPGAGGYGAFFAKLDEGGKSTEKPTRIPLAGDGAATSIVIEHGPTADASGLRAIVARSSPEAISIDAIELAKTPPKASSLIALDGPSSLDVALVLDRGVLYFNDDGPHPSDRRARRARIAWSR
jgi:hypothetical protein